MLERDDFNKLLIRAWRQDFLARLAGRPNDLLPFEVLTEALRSYQQIVRQKPEMIPLDRIVGSVGRYRDFTRAFLPRSSALADRWMRVDRAMESLAGVPPIQVYQVGDVYFVADGNHRVSVARANGFDAIEAYVTEIPIDAGLAPGDTLDQAIIKAERVRFLAETRLDQHCPTPDIHFTRPGGFPRLLDHIHLHRRRARDGHPGSEPLSLEDAAANWYEQAYLPIVEVIRRRGLLQRFPGRTAADLYIWIWGYILEAYQLFGERVSPEEGAEMLAIRAPSSFRQTVDGLLARLSELSGGLLGPGANLPDWVSQTFEWEDGSLAELSQRSTESTHG